MGATPFLAFLAIVVVWYVVGYVMGKRTVKPMPWTQCADCAARTRKVRPHQLFVEVWGADGVLRAKCPVGVRGGPHTDEHSLLLDRGEDVEQLADFLRERVVALYKAKAV